MLLPFLLLLFSICTNGAVVGIDFGSEFIKVSLVRPGSTFHIVLDETSKRKIPAIVAFDARERQFGNNALGLTVKKADSSYMFMQRLLGKKIDSPEVKEIQNRGYPYKFVEVPGRNGAVGIQHNEDTIYSPEELIAMNFEHVKKLCELDAEGRPVQDAVITVPGYWTQNEREAIVTAAEMAGFHVLSLINQNTAAAIQYGIDRKQNESDPGHKIILYNMGSSATEVSLVEYTSFQQKVKKKNSTTVQFEIKGYSADPFLGGSEFEDRIVKYLVQQWTKAHPKADILKENRPMAKLRKAAGDVKKVLSANKDTPIFIASLMNDIDFKSSLTREQFIDLSKDLLDRVTAPVDRILTEQGLAKKDIDAIVLVGGGVRIPAIQQKLKEYMGMELTQSLDGDEAITLGAVFRAANLSTAFQVRKLGMTDITVYPAEIRLSDLSGEGEVAVPHTDEPELDEEVEPTSDGEASSMKKFSKRTQLFSRHNRLAKRKTVAFSHVKDFTCALNYEVAAILPEGSNKKICSYNITGLDGLMANPKYQALLADQKPKVSVSFSLSSSGIISLVKAEATLEEMVKVAVPKPKSFNASKIENATNSEESKASTNSSESVESDAGTTNPSQDSEEGTKAEAEEEKAKEETESKPVDKEDDESDPSDLPNPEDESSANASNTVVEQEQVEYKMQKKTHRVDLKISMGFPGDVTLPMNSTMVKAGVKRLNDLNVLDVLRIKIAESKNKLEAAIYEIRGLLEDEVIQSVSTEIQRESVVEVLTSTENWLSEQEDDEFKKFDDKLAAIQALFGPVQFRAKELFERPVAINKTLLMVNYTRDMVKNFEKERPWIPVEDKDTLIAMVDYAEDWLRNKTAEQDALQAHEAPAYSSEQLLDQLRPIAKFSTQLLKRVKPIVKEDKSKVKKKTNSTVSNQTKAENETASEKESSDTTEQPHVQEQASDKENDAEIAAEKEL